MHSDPPQRQITKSYRDPLDLVWLCCIESLGWQLARSHELFASWDGKKTLTLGEASDLDPDDSLAQLILHELCHALIEGREGWSKRDWGLENIDHRHLVNELACHRLQASLADRVQLRSFFAVTTDWRCYYDQIPPTWDQAQDEQALKHWSQVLDTKNDQSGSKDMSEEAHRLDLKAIGLAQNALKFFETEKLWFRSIMLALEQTEQIAQILKSSLSASAYKQDSLWS